MSLVWLRQILIFGAVLWVITLIFGGDAQLARDLLNILNFVGIAIAVHILTNIVIEEGDDDV